MWNKSSPIAELFAHNRIEAPFTYTGTRMKKDRQICFVRIVTRTCCFFWPHTLACCDNFPIHMRILP
jgi:hypothetical protein